MRDLTSILQPDGKLLVAGYTQGGNQKHRAGTLQSRRHAGQRLRQRRQRGHRVRISRERAEALLLDSWAASWVGGDFGVARYHAQSDSGNGIQAGDLDSSFGIGGRVSIFSYVRRMELDSQGRLVLLTNGGVARLDGRRQRRSEL